MDSSLAGAPPHPFPARMAPEIALQAVLASPAGGVVADPMCGSGTVLRTAQLSGRNAYGWDMDPLAVLIARVWTQAASAHLITSRALELIAMAGDLNAADCSLPWLDDDPDTRAFVDYWFVEPQQSELRKLAWLLSTEEGSVADALRLALSRTIITKDKGASVARDVSHSRPHRVRDVNDYDVTIGFRRAAGVIAGRLAADESSSVTVSVGDARSVVHPSGSIECIVSSPPYLNAIDYMRGHRMTLVWLGHRVDELRAIRGESVGTERGLRDESEWEQIVTKSVGDSLPPREHSIVRRYVADMMAVILEMRRLLTSTGQLVLVVGESTLRGSLVETRKIIQGCAESAAFQLTDSNRRDIPARHRYLPPPSIESGALNSRMKHEWVLSFAPA